MTDHELLELAAKAAGHDFVLHTEYDDEKDEYKTRTWIREPERLVEWNPLTDDGDALRLAVVLNMGISIPVFNKHRADVISFRHPLANAIEEGNDPYATTRRAIVRAAAEIGKEMK